MQSYHLPKRDVSNSTMEGFLREYDIARMGATRFWVEIRFMAGVRSQFTSIVSHPHNVAGASTLQRNVIHCDKKAENNVQQFPG